MTGSSKKQVDIYCFKIIRTDTNEKSQSLQVHITFGQKVNTLSGGYKQAGIHSANLTASDLPSGLYFVRLAGINEIRQRKVVLIR